MSEGRTVTEISRVLGEIIEQERANVTGFGKPLESAIRDFMGRAAGVLAGRYQQKFRDVRCRLTFTFEAADAKQYDLIGMLNASVETPIELYDGIVREKK